MKRMEGESRKSWRNERGVVVVLSVLFIIIIGAFLALVVNIGLAMSIRNALQNGSDSAALAGAGSLDGTATGITTASSKAKSYANAHYVQKDTIQIADSDVVFGKWNFDTRSFTSVSELLPKEITAVKVLNGRDGVSGRNSKLGVIFGVFL